MDVVNDLKGNYVCTFVKRKFSMRAGNTDQAVTVRDDRLEKIGQIIGEKLGRIGLFRESSPNYLIGSRLRWRISI